MLASLLAIALGAAAPGTALKQLEAKPTVVQVLPLASESGVDPASARILTEFLASALGLHRDLKVFGQNDLQELMRNVRDSRKAGCDSAADACLAEVAGALGAEWLVTGTVGRIGDALVLSVRILDTHKRNVLAQGSKVTLGQPSDLLRAVDELVPELLQRIGREDVPPPSGHSALAYGLAVGTGAMVLTAAIVGGITLASYVQQNNARNAFLSGGNPGTADFQTSLYAAPQNSLRVTAAITDGAMLLAIGLGVGTVIAW